jgi:nitrite reductase/ring-hydroxylating ferredoxin subunit
MSDFIKIATVDEIAPGQAKLVEVNGKEIALFNVGGQFHAIDNNCTHVGGPGRALGPPAVEAVNRYNLRIVDGSIEVEV